MRHLPNREAVFSQMLSRLLAAYGLLVIASALDDESVAYYRSVAERPVSDSGKFSLVLLTSAAEADGAVCLDGSPGAYYLREGSGDGAQKWYVHHEGGGWCESLDDCHYRSYTYLGSTQFSLPTMSPVGGYFSQDPAVNPMMHNWNMVYLRYCDGGSFTGDKSTPTNHANTQLHFRGRRIREAMLASLLADHKLGAATDVVIGGCSAGGLATYLHADHWCDALAKATADPVTGDSAACVAMPDSGFFLDYESPARRDRFGDLFGRRLSTRAGTYREGMRWLFYAMNASAGVGSECLAAYRGRGGPSANASAYLCIFAEHAAPFVRTPLFALQPEFDSWQQSHVLGEGGSVAVMGANVSSRLQSALLKPHRRNGAFLDSCSHHCGAWGEIRIDGLLVADAFAQWYESVRQGTRRPRKRLWRQGRPFPCKGCCQPDGVAAPLPPRWSRWGMAAVVLAAVVVFLWRKRAGRSMVPNALRPASRRSTSSSSNWSISM